MTKADADRTRVFLSYSRKDLDFVAWLASALAEEGVLADFDQSEQDPAQVATGIAAEDAWWARLDDLITAAAVMVFVVSPDSIRSKVCDEEIAFAQALGKRIIPILWRPIDYAKAPPRLAALNVKIAFTDQGKRATSQALKQLARAVQQDVKWLRVAARARSLSRAHRDHAAIPRRRAALA